MSEKPQSAVAFLLLLRFAFKISQNLNLCLKINDEKSSSRRRTVHDALNAGISDQCVFCQAIN
jgi:hypothetical protein